MFKCAHGRPSNIKGGLYIAGAPHGNPATEGFDAVVLCAMEYQPKMTYGIEVIRAPMIDDKINDHTIEIAAAAAARVAELLEQNKKVLVTCIEGRNRSGLVAAMALINEGMDGKEAISLVRKRRRSSKPPLANPYFVDFLKTYRSGV
jgi:protein-tyrosine phosphatase